ncbi:MAG: hypothetical protein ABEJ85_06295 [Haloarculaceae archaeon]
MAGAIYLASTVVMGLLIVGIVVLMRERPWHRYSPQAAYGQLRAGGDRPTSALHRLAARPGVWTVAFVLLALGLMAGTTVYVSGSGPALSGPVLIAGLAGLVVLYLVGSIYFVLREHGRPTAQAVGASVVTLGVLFVLGIALKLVLAG